MSSPNQTRVPWLSRCRVSDSSVPSILDGYRVLNFKTLGFVPSTRLVWRGFCTLNTCTAASRCQEVHFHVAYGSASATGIRRTVTLAGSKEMSVSHKICDGCNGPVSS